jgi:hypothetical protein
LPKFVRDIAEELWSSTVAEEFKSATLLWGTWENERDVVQKVPRLIRYGLRLITITFPTSTSTPEAVGFLLIALDLSDPVNRQFRFIRVQEGLVTCLQVMHPVRTFFKPGLSFLFGSMPLYAVYGDPLQGS